MSGHRQAAVALHGLVEADRRLILAQLPAPDQATLRGYLAELTELGFDGDAIAVDDMVPAGDAIPVELAQASPAMMLGLLAQEPAALVAQVLALEDWRWREGLLALLTPARRDAVLAAHVSPAPARDRFLRQSLTARLAHAVPEHKSAPAKSPWLATVRRWGSTWR